jgi:hypothetical protein
MAIYRDHVRECCHDAIAFLAVAVRPKAGGRLSMVIEERSVNNNATLSGFWLHHAFA